METNTKQTGNKLTSTFLGGVLFSCLVVIVLGVCAVGSLVFFVARTDVDAWTGWQSNTPGGSGGSSGQMIFQTRCSHCHSTGTDKRVGPGLAGLFSPGGPVLPDGVDYDRMLPNGKEINDANVAEWIQVGGSGEIGSMPGMSMGEKQMSDLIGYLKTLHK